MIVASHPIELLAIQHVGSFDDASADIQMAAIRLAVLHYKGDRKWQEQLPTKL